MPLWRINISNIKFYKMQKLIWAFVVFAVFTSSAMLGQNTSISTAKYIGIGIDNPAYPLQIFDDDSHHAYMNFSNVTTGSTSGNGVLVGIDPNEDFRIHSYEDNNLRFYTDNLFRMIVKNDGKVGINIADPLEGFHIHHKNLLITDNTLNNAIRMQVNGAGDAGELSLYDNDGDRTLILRGAENVSDGSQILMRNADGDKKIELDGDGFGNGGHISLYDTDTTETIIITGAQNVSDGAAITMYNANGDQTILLDADHVGTNGVGRVITDELQINGGSDLSEYFNIDKDHGKSQPGMVVSISPDGSGNLQLSSVSYDKTVAGVISGANGVRTGLMMGQESSIAHGDTPVVLAGRAYVLTDATAAPIQPGDLLTTSSTPGHAMKVMEYQKAQGAILGKAMTRLEEGTGYVLVLVNLQ